MPIRMYVSGIFCIIVLFYFFTYSPLSLKSFSRLMNDVGRMGYIACMFSMHEKHSLTSMNTQR